MQKKVKYKLTYHQKLSLQHQEERRQESGTIHHSSLSFPQVFSCIMQQLYSNQLKQDQDGQDLRRHHFELAPACHV